MPQPDKYIRVEYDENFSGGDYMSGRLKRMSEVSNVGSFAFVSLININNLGSVEAAFRATTGIATLHIVHYSEDELYDADGELVES